MRNGHNETMASDPAGGSFIGLQRKLAGLPQSGSLDPARRLIGKLRPAVRGDAVGLLSPPPAGSLAASQSRQLAAAETVHVIAQVERVLDAEVAAQNRAAAAPAAAATPKGKPMSNITGASQLGQSANARIAAAKAKIEAANEKMDGAFKNLDTATASIEDVAKKVEQEAADLTSATAQLTNGG
jgi:hypothetical protein